MATEVVKKDLVDISPSQLDKTVRGIAERLLPRSIYLSRMNRPFFSRYHRNDGDFYVRLEVPEMVTRKKFFLFGECVAKVRRTVVLWAKLNRSYEIAELTVKVRLPEPLNQKVLHEIFSASYFVR